MLPIHWREGRLTREQNAPDGRIASRDLAKQCEPIHVTWHMKVRNDDVWNELFESGQRSDRRLRAHDHVAMPQ